MNDRANCHNDALLIAAIAIASIEIVPEKLSSPMKPGLPPEPMKRSSSAIRVMLPEPVVAFRTVRLWPPALAAMSWMLPHLGGGARDGHVKIAQSVEYVPPDPATRFVTVVLALLSV